MNSWGIIGIGRIGLSMARNMSSKGISLSLYDKSFEEKQDVLFKGKNLHTELNKASFFKDILRFVESIEKPRKVLILVPSGKPTDNVIGKLLQILDEGDIIIDAGNTNPIVSFNNKLKVQKNKMLYLGIGVSGGVQGVLDGPSIMIGGDNVAFNQVKDDLSLITSKSIDNSKSYDLFGDSNQGHFVKMVHNGIEYVEMQLIASIYKLLISSNNYKNQEIAEIFHKWNKTELKSYLLEISIKQILERTDDNYLIEKIDDEAKDNGTGRWMLNYGIELGIPLSMLSSAMDTRFISRFKSFRKEISKMTKQSSNNYTIDIKSLKIAYQFCRHINFIQAFCLINAANKNYDWNISVSKALNVWSNGSIIKSSQINDLFLNYSVENILSDKKIIKDLNDYKPEIINVILISLKNDISIPCFSEALNYFNSISNNSLSTKIIQAQRNFFGSHPIKIN
ncbi:NAD(P)-binding domain-containing protein [Flavobacteriaceae bacterium]|nr:NAD(P)-binding domain-containing protein [Flavobacteriaceae bacterium]